MTRTDSLNQVGLRPVCEGLSHLPYYGKTQPTTQAVPFLRLGVLDSVRDRAEHKLAKEGAWMYSLLSAVDSGDGVTLYFRLLLL